MTDTYRGVGLTKGNFFDIITGYCFFTPPIDEPGQNLAKELDRSWYQFVKTDKNWEAFVGEFRRLKGKAVGTIRTSVLVASYMYYRELRANAHRAKQLGNAQTFIAFLDAEKSGKYNPSQLTDKAVILRIYSISLCVDGDQFYCGVQEALRDIIERQGPDINASYPMGYLGRTFAPYFGRYLWDECRPMEERDRSCRTAQPREQQWEIDEPQSTKVATDSK